MIAWPIVCAIVLLVPYKYEHTPYHVLQLTVPNPTSYVFHISIDSIFSVLDWRKYRDNKSDYPLKRLGYDYKRNSWGSIKGYIYLTGAIFPSALYRNESEGLEQYYQCNLACDSLSPDKTRITVVPVFSSILKGVNYYVWHRGGLPWISSVPASTIEEYRILHLIGNMVGEKGMPPIRYPKELTPEEIKVLDAY